LLPAVAYDSVNKGYLVVWQDLGNSNSETEIYGQLLNADHTPNGSNFAISDASAAPGMFYPNAVAYDSVNQKYLVVWGDTRNSGVTVADIYGQLVIAASGNLSGGNFPISTGSEYYPSVAYDSANERYLVVWQDNRNANSDIYGRLVKADGTLSGDDFPVIQDFVDQYTSGTAYNSNCKNFLVTYWSVLNNSLTIMDSVVGPCWSIEKKADHSELTLSADQQHTVNYSVTLYTPNHMGDFDNCIDVSDENYYDFGLVCFPITTLPYTFNYSRSIGPYEECGDYTVKNTATFRTTDTEITGSDSWTITVHVPCVGGCTLSQGYWKTHSKYGPAPYADIWAQKGVDTAFFSSGQTWYQVLWATNAGGNAYYILAKQYVAAQLNILNGAASTAQVDAAIAWATTFFNTYTPSSTLSKTVRNNAVSYASLLEKYNSGYIGPGHCSE
jgi:hypothetical protein